MKKRKEKRIDYKQIVENIANYLFLDKDMRDEFINLEKEWDAETIEAVAEQVRKCFKMSGKTKYTRMKFHPAKIDESVLVHVSGGVVQGASATNPGISVEVFDADDRKASNFTDDQIGEAFENLKRSHGYKYGVL